MTQAKPRVRTGTVHIDFAARSAEVLGTGQRIAALAVDEMDEEAKALSDAIRNLFGAKDASLIPEMFLTLMKHPGIYRTHLELGLALNKNGSLPPRERELVILRVGWLVGSPFEWGEHVDVGYKCGLTAGEIERVKHGSDAAGWNEHDRAVVRGAEELVDDHVISDATWAVLRKSWTDQQMIELPGLVGSYTMTAMLYNTLRFALLPGNAGFTQK